MTYLLDTNVISELRKPAATASAHVRDWTAARPRDSQFISVTTVMELETGVRQRERRDPAQGRILRAWLEDTVLTEFSDRILPVSLEVSRRTAALHVPDRRPQSDAMIAGTALVHDMTLVTRKVADFLPMGVRVINPWENTTA